MKLGTRIAIMAGVVGGILFVIIRNIQKGRNR